VDLDVDDLLHVVEAKRMEEDDLIDAVEKLRPEMLAERLGHLPPHAFREITGMVGDELAPEIRRHDDDGVLEVDRASLAVGQTAVVEQLEEYV
jgi:hypothetical protein